MLTPTQPTLEQAVRPVAGEPASVTPSPVNRRAGESGRDWGRVTVWLAGLVVAAGAGVATAHGLFEVARAATVPAEIAWLYPVITDGLALVAYVATTRLGGHGRGYAWCVVVLAATLSGLAQASLLADGLATAATPLRFGVGAWPAIAAALAAHLLFLLAHSDVPTGSTPVGSDGHRGEPYGVYHPISVDHFVDVGDDLSVGAGCTPDDRLVRGVPAVPNDHRARVPGVPRGTPQDAAHDHGGSAEVSHDDRSAGLRPVLPPADRAIAIAELHRRREGRLPSVRELVAGARVGQGTAARVLQELRDRPAGLHAVDEQAPDTEPRPTDGSNS